jgi:hypothetical protein
MASIPKVICAGCCLESPTTPSTASANCWLEHRRLLLKSTTYIFRELCLPQIPSAANSLEMSDIEEALVADVKEETPKAAGGAGGMGGMH